MYDVRWEMSQMGVCWRWVVWALRGVHPQVFNAVESDV